LSTVSAELEAELLAQTAAGLMENGISIAGLAQGSARGPLKLFDELRNSRNEHAEKLLGPPKHKGGGMKESASLERTDH
jgi:hypothetical protein